MEAQIIVTLVCGLLIAVGVAGIIVPVLPGAITIGVSLLIWALVLQNTVGWVVFALGAINRLLEEQLGDAEVVRGGDLEVLRGRLGLQVDQDGRPLGAEHDEGGQGTGPQIDLHDRPAEARHLGVAAVQRLHERRVGERLLGDGAEVIAGVEDVEP